MEGAGKGRQICVEWTWVISSEILQQSPRAQHSGANCLSYCICRAGPSSHPFVKAPLSWLRSHSSCCPSKSPTMDNQWTILRMKLSAWMCLDPWMDERDVFKYDNTIVGVKSRCRPHQSWSLHWFLSQTQALGAIAHTLYGIDSGLVTVHPSYHTLQRPTPMAQSLRLLHRTLRLSVPHFPCPISLLRSYPPHLCIYISSEACPGPH